MTETFTGIPAPDFLPDDPWFGPAIYSKKQQDYMIDQLVKENLIILENNGSVKSGFQGLKKKLMPTMIASFKFLPFYKTAVYSIS